MFEQFDDFTETIEKFECYFGGSVNDDTGEIDGVLETYENYTEEKIKEILKEACFKGSVEEFRDPEEIEDVSTFKIKGKVVEEYDPRALAARWAWVIGCDYEGEHLIDILEAIICGRPEMVENIGLDPIAFADIKYYYANVVAED